MAHRARSGVGVDRAARSASTSNNRYYKNHVSLYGQLTDSNTLGIWLNGYVNGARGKTLIDPLSTGHIGLVHYCEDHSDAPVLDAARKVFGTDK